MRTCLQIVNIFMKVVDDGGHKRLVTVSGMDGLHRFADYPFLSDSDFGIKN